MTTVPTIQTPADAPAVRPICTRCGERPQGHVTLRTRPEHTALCAACRQRDHAAADFGVAQERRRVFVVGERGAGRPPVIEAPRLPRVPVSAILDADDACVWSPVAGHCAATLARIEASRGRYGERFVVPYYGSADHGRSLSRPLGTVTTVDRYALVHGDRMRMLSVAEYRRAMGFPDDYVLKGTRRDHVKLLGNAVVPHVARSVVAQLLGASAQEAA